MRIYEYTVVKYNVMDSRLMCVYLMVTIPGLIPALIKLRILMLCKSTEEILPAKHCFSLNFLIFSG